VAGDLPVPQVKELRCEGTDARDLELYQASWFGYGISFMWISFSSATTTLIVGWLASFLFAPPGKAAQNLVYRVNRNAFEEQEASVS